MKKFSIGLLFASTVFAVPASPAFAGTGTWTVGTGVSFSSGDYGEVSKTKVLAAPVSLTYRNGPWKFRTSLPWVRISGPGSILQTPEGRDAGGALGGSNSGSGSSGSGSGSDNSGSGSSGSGSGSSGSGSGSSGGSGSGSSGSGSGGSGSGSGSSGGSGSGSGSGSGGGDVVDDDGSPNSTGKRSGIGDLVVAATYSAALGNGFYLEPTMKVKIPTASRSKRIGTGKTDFTPSLDLVKEVGNATFYVHGRRKFAGKPAGSNIRSTWGAGVGGSTRAGAGVLVGLDYDWQQSSIKGRGSSSEVTGWTNFRLTPRIGLTLSGTKGLNKNSADYAAALALAFRL